MRHWIIFIIIFIYCLPVFGYDNLIDSRPLGMGGATRAIAGSNTALYLNPAGMSLGNVYHVQTLYYMEPMTNSHLGGVSIVDSVTSGVGAGLHFSYFNLDPDGEDREDYDIRLGLSYAIGQWLCLGVTIKYLYTDRNGEGPLGTALMPSSGDPLLNTVTVDAGLIIKLGDRFFLGAVGYNLTNLDSLFAPLRAGFGAATTIIDNLTIAFDVLLDFTSRDETLIYYMGGMEYFLINHIPIRIGYQYDGLDLTHNISGGLGYIDQNFGIEASFFQEIDGPKDTILTLTLKYFSN